MTRESTRCAGSFRTSRPRRDQHHSHPHPSGPRAQLVGVRRTANLRFANSPPHPLEGETGCRKSLASTARRRSSDCEPAVREQSSSPPLKGRENCCRSRHERAGSRHRSRPARTELVEAPRPRLSAIAGMTMRRSPPQPRWIPPRQAPASRVGTPRPRLHLDERRPFPPSIRVLLRRTPSGRQFVPCRGRRSRPRPGFGRRVLRIGRHACRVATPRVT
jgi:hypothetical protein